MRISPVGWERIGDFGKDGNCSLKDIDPKEWSWHILGVGNQQFFFKKAIKMVNRFQQMASGQQWKAQARTSG